MNRPLTVEPVSNPQHVNSRGFEQAEMYRLSADKLSRNHQKIERRKFKNRLSDRRSQMRLSSDGQPQQDRRVANRVAYAQMYSQLKQPQ